MIDAAPVISTHGLTKRFRDVEAVAGIDLRVPAGGVYGFLGPNGAGKTTTIRMLLGLIRPTRGTATLFDQRVEPGNAVLERVGALVERPAFYPYLTATDNLRLVGHLRGMAESRLRLAVPEVLDRVGLADAAGRKPGRFSTGMRQRLGIAAALMDRPGLVILDEPANGLDPNGVVDIRNLISALARDGITIFLSSHVLPEVEQLCRRVAILQAGRIVAEGETQAMLQQGERLYVRFDAEAEAQRARPILDRIGVTTPADVPSALLIEADTARGSEVIRTLASNDLFPAEVRVRRPTLETVFIELTAEHDEVPSCYLACRAGDGRMTGIIRAEILRLRKRGSLILILIAVPLLATVFFGLGYASIYESEPFDPVQSRADMIRDGYVIGMPPVEAEQFLDDMVAQQAADHVRQVEYTKLQRAVYAFPQSLVTILGNAMFLLLGLVLLTATVMGDEFGWGTIRTTLLGSSHRWRVLLVRIAALWLTAGLIVVLMLVAATLAPLFLNVASHQLPTPMPAVNPLALGAFVGGILLAALVVIAFATLATVIVRNGALTLVSVLVYVVVEGAVLALLTRFDLFGFDYEHSRPGELAWTLDALPAHGFVTLMDTGARAASSIVRYEGDVLPQLSTLALPLIAFVAWGAIFGLLALWRFGRMDIVE